MSISWLVTDGSETWLETRQFYFYSKHEAKKLFKQWLKDNSLRMAA